jgi:hypothetical protein
MSEPAQVPTEAAPAAEEAISAAEVRTKRILILGLVVVGLLLVGMVALLVVLSIDAYDAALSGAAPGPGAVVVSLLRDAAIILVAFETLVIGLLVLILIVQVQALVTLLRDEIKPMLEAVNETVATVRGTARFMSHSVVSPTIRTASFLAGLRRVVKEVVDLVTPGRRGSG